MAKTVEYDLTEWAKSITLTIKPMRKITVTLFIGKKKKFYFHVQAKNRKIICQSEAYNTIQSAKKTIALLQGSNDWDFKDLTKEK